MMETVTTIPGAYQWRRADGIPGLDHIEIGEITTRARKMWHPLAGYDRAEVVLPDGKTVFAKIKR